MRPVFSIAITYLAAAIQHPSLSEHKLPGLAATLLLDGRVLITGGSGGESGNPILRLTHIGRPSKEVTIGYAESQAASNVFFRFVQHHCVT